MKKTERSKFFSLLLPLAAVLLLVLSYPVRADDDEDEGGSSSSSSSSSKATVKTDVSTKVDTVILKDSDGDGILDQDDPHPSIAEIYIVEDADQNGIVDKFENPNAVSQP